LSDRQGNDIALRRPSPRNVENVVRRHARVSRFRQSATTVRMCSRGSGESRRMERLGVASEVRCSSSSSGCWSPRITRLNPSCRCVSVRRTSGSLRSWCGSALARTHPSGVERRSAQRALNGIVWPRWTKHSR